MPYATRSITRPRLLMPLERTNAHQQNNIHHVVNWARVFGKCTVLHELYFPTFWGWFCQIIIHMYISFILMKKTAPLIMKARSEEDVLHMDDGETCTLDWFRNHQANVQSTPVIAIMPGVTGKTADFADLIFSVMASTEFQVVVLNRRGHGKPLSKPHFNTSGDLEDCIHMFEHIKAKCPLAPVYAISISAGTALMLSYLGHLRERAVPKAAICLCSGLDTDYCISEIPPLMRKLLLTMLKKHFVSPNFQLLQQHGQEICDALLKTNCLLKFNETMFKINQHRGYISKEEFEKKMNPMAWQHLSVTPTLFINCIDDPIFTASIYQKGKSKILQNPMNAIVEMDNGGHFCFYEGFFKPTKWSNRVALQFFKVIAEEQSLA